MDELQRAEEQVRVGGSVRMSGFLVKQSGSSSDIDSDQDLFDKSYGYIRQYY